MTVKQILALYKESLEAEIEDLKNQARIMYLVASAVLSKEGFKELKKFLKEEIDEEDYI